MCNEMPFFFLVLFLQYNTEQDLYPIILKKVNGPIKENSGTIMKEILKMETLLSKIHWEKYSKHIHNLFCLHPVNVLLYEKKW